MPGHEIVGRVAQAGADVTKFKIGDLVGVGCMVDSCHQCSACEESLENYCEKGFLATYNGNMRNPNETNLTFGGYSQKIVVREDFVLEIPANLDPAKAAPILCAGVTTYSPLRHWNVGPGTQVGIVGFGGLGHMAVQLAKAMGADVTLITTSPEKKDDALALGAKDVVVSTDKDAMAEYEMKLDFILSTIPQSHDINLYIPLLKREGVLTIVGCIAPTSKPVDLSKLITDRKSIGTSLIGGIAETQEVLDFCSTHNISANVQVIPIQGVNEAFNKIDKGEVDFRFVIDMESLKGAIAD